MGRGKGLSGKLKSSVNKCRAVRPGENLITACHNTTYLTQQRPSPPVTRPFISLTLSLSFSLSLHPVITSLFSLPHSHGISSLCLLISPAFSLPGCSRLSSFPCLSLHLLFSSLSSFFPLAQQQNCHVMTAEWSSWGDFAQKSTTGVEFTQAKAVS